MTPAASAGSSATHPPDICRPADPGGSLADAPADAKHRLTWPYTPTSHEGRETLLKASTAAAVGIGATAAVIVAALVQGAGDDPVGTALSLAVPAEYQDLIEDA